MIFLLRGNLLIKVNIDYVSVLTTSSNINERSQVIKNVVCAWQKQQMLTMWNKLKVPVAHIRACNSDFHNFNTERNVWGYRGWEECIFALSHQLQQCEYTLSPAARVARFHQIQSFGTLYLISDFPLVKETSTCIVLIAILSKYFIYNHSRNILSITFSTIGSRLCYCWLNSGSGRCERACRTTFIGV